jgi:hypothetical protein
MAYIKVKSVCVAFSLFALFFFSEGRAAIFECRGCSASVMEYQARHQGPGTHVVYDLATGTTLGFEVHYEPDVWTGGGYWDQMFAAPTSVDPEVQALIDSLSIYFGETNGLMASFITVALDDLDNLPSGVSGASAYDIVRNANIRAMLGDRLAQGNIPGASNAFFTLVNMGMSIAGVTSGTVLEVTVVSADGTSTVFKIEVGVGSAEYQSGRARTEDGQLIPEANSPNYAGTYSSPSADFVGHLGGLGIPVSGGGGGGSIIWLECVWDGQNLHCTIVEEGN